MAGGPRWARIVRRMADLQYRLLDRFRHPDAFDVREPQRPAELSGFAGQHTCLLVSYRKTGEPVPSPITFALSDGKFYLRTEPRTAKVRRIRRDARVLLAPCSFRGKPRAAFAAGTARILPPADHQRAHDILRASYRLVDKLYEGAVDHLPVELTYLEITPE
jgi:PPOX class probable F420-dependent enzyme